jgi:hypothetical protein
VARWNPHGNVGIELWIGRLKRQRGVKVGMNTTGQASANDAASDREEKRLALGYVQEAWAEARLDGIDGDCLAQACLFSALAELVATYGEDAAATFTEGLSARIHNGEFSLDQSRQ